MRKSHFADAQTIGMCKEQEAGLPTPELCQNRGLSPATFYKMKAKYNGMELSEDRRWNATGPRGNGDTPEATRG